METVACSRSLSIMQKIYAILTVLITILSWNCAYSDHITPMAMRIERNNLQISVDDLDLYLEIAIRDDLSVTSVQYLLNQGAVPTLNIIEMASIKPHFMLVLPSLMQKFNQDEASLEDMQRILMLAFKAQNFPAVTILLEFWHTHDLFDQPNVMADSFDEYVAEQDFDNVYRMIDLEMVHEDQLNDYGPSLLYDIRDSRL